MTGLPLHSTVPRRIFVLWLGDAPMSKERRSGLASLKHKSEAELVLVRDDDISDWIVPGHPLHPAFAHLSAIHRSDHLRTYLMHFHGGGYADVKPTTGSWLPAFELIDSTDLLGVGYQEIGRHGVAVNGVNTQYGKYQPSNLMWWKYRFLQLNYRHLLGNCAYIFRPASDITYQWYCEQLRRLDEVLPALLQHPAQYPKERGGVSYDGVVSRYPVPWSYLLGDIFHPLCYRFRRRLGQTVPTPDFSLPYE